MRIPKSLWCLLTVTLIAPPPATAQSGSALMDSLRLLDPSILPGAVKADADCKAVGPFWTLLGAIADEEAYNRRFRSTVNMSLEGNEASGVLTADQEEDDERRQRYTLNSRMSAGYGSYPGEFKFRAGIGVALEDGKFRENVSDFGVAYDRYVKDWAEFFVFADRYSDNFMSIDQRYEVGGGVVVPLWKSPTHGRTPDGRRYLARTAYQLPGAIQIRKETDLELDSLRNAVDQSPLDAQPAAYERLESREKEIQAEQRQAVVAEAWAKCYLKAVAALSAGGSAAPPPAQPAEPAPAAAAAPAPAVPAPDQDAAQIARLTRLARQVEDARDWARKSADKRFFKFRTAVAVGAFVEFEKATLQSRFRRDTTFLDEGGMAVDTFVIDTVTASLEGERKIRLQIRPTFEWQPSDAVTVGLHPYFKLPAPGDGWRVEVPTGDSASKKVFDVRYDIQSWLEVELSAGPPSVTLWLRYRFLYDRAPPSATVRGRTLVARDTRNTFQLGFGLKW